MTVAEKDVYTMKVINALGAEVWTQVKPVEAGNNQFSISSGNFTPGIYTLQIQTAKGSMNKTFIVH
jgi:hypothetical protein